MKIRIKNPIWGIPITGLKYLWSDGTIHTEYNGITTQFEIMGWSRHNDLDMDGGYWIGGCNDATINGKIVYRRILIRRR